MRRILAIVLMLVFGLPGLTPLFALASASDTSGPETKLPACCRRAGVHHCTPVSMATSGSLRVSAPVSHCPFYPTATSVVTHQTDVQASDVAAVHIPASAEAVLSNRQGVQQSGLRVARSTRGPPVFATL